MIELTNEIKKHLLMYYFDDQGSAFFEDKFYKAMHVEYIYDAIEEVLSKKGWILDDPWHIGSFVEKEHYEVEFKYYHVTYEWSDKEVYADAIVLFDQGVCKSIYVEGPDIDTEVYKI